DAILPTSTVTASLTSQRLVAIALLAVGLLTGAGAAVYFRHSAGVRAPGITARYTIALEAPDWLGLDRPTFASSPAGSHFVSLERTDAGDRLYVRSVDQAQGRPLVGSDHAATPFFAPDGEWVGFHADGKLKRVSFRGGTPVDIAAVPTPPLGAVW